MTSPEVSREAVRLRFIALVYEARDNVNAFIELAFKNDQPEKRDGPAANKPFKQQWFHAEWQEMWSHRVSVIIGPTGFGKTEQTVARIIWELGRNPQMRIAIVGASFDAAQEKLAKVKRQIEQNEIVRSVFPRLRPGDVWSTEALRVQDAGIDTTTNSVMAYGVDAGQILGKRADLVFLDDVENLQTTLTTEARAKTLEWADAVVQTRLTTRGRMAIIANAWHRDDLAHTYGKRPGVVFRKYPAEDRVTGKLLWPSFRGREYLDEQAGTMTETAYARAFLCEPRDEGTRVFKGEWIQKARTKGAGHVPRFSVERAFTRDGELRNQADIDRLGVLMASEWKIVIGLDLATGETEKKRKTDFSCFNVVALDPQWNRHLFWIEKGRWSGPEILQRMRVFEARYHPDLWMVETNGTQKWMLQFAREVPDFGPVQAHHTGTQKWSESLGIESIGAEMKAGRWVIPSPNVGETDAAYRARLSPEAARAYDLMLELQTHLLDFTRVGHTPDDVMSLWFSQRGAERLGQGGGLAREDESTPETDEAGHGATVERLFAEDEELIEMPTDYALRALGLVP